MRNLILLAAVYIITGSAFGQVGSDHAWSVAITVVDETNQPVSGAKVSAIFWTPVSQTKEISTNISGISDSGGIFRASHPYTGFPAMLFRAEKEGFYKTLRAYDLGDYYDAFHWNPSLQLMLKKIENPIPMYAKQVSLVVPAFEKPVGFDLAAGDWVGPYGKGKSADILFTSHYYNKRGKTDFDHQLIVSFPNIGDGIQSMVSPVEEAGSDLRSPHQAPISGYEEKLIRFTSRHPGKSMVYDYDGNRAYLFRVRTVLDEKGNVKTALYGKIYGDFMQFRYYLNPSPNDRNIEFDQGHNLFPGKDTFSP